MIKIENVEIDGMRAAVRGMRNPLESWAKMDGEACGDIDDCADCRFTSDSFACLKSNANTYIAGPADVKLMRQLAAAGTDHGKFMRMIHVSFDVTAGHTFWAEFDTYKVGTVRNSCSKMHRIHVHPFSCYDFDHEGIDDVSGDMPEVKEVFFNVIITLEKLRVKFNQTHEKKYWRAMIELLPMGYHLRATIDTNYAVLRNIYHARRNHKLDEWRDFCRWCETLPYSELITGGRNDAV